MDDIVDSAVWFRDLARVTADEIARLQAENTQVRRELDKADRTNEALRAENDRLVAEVQALSNAPSLVDENIGLRAEVERLRAIVVEDGKELDRLRAMLADKISVNNSAKPVD